MTITVLNTKISTFEHKIRDNSKLTAENFAARLKQAGLVNKTDFDNNLSSFNRRTTSNKITDLEVQKKLIV